MSMPQIYIDDEGSDRLERVNAVLAHIPNGAQKACNAAIKRAANTAKTEAGRFAAAVYNISKGQFMANTSINGTVSGWGGAGASSVTVTYSGAMLDLLEFKPLVGSDGVKFQAKRGNEIHLRHAFDIQAYGGHIFERVGRPRFPIKQDKGPATPWMVGDSDVAEPLAAKIESVFDQRLDHEISRILSMG